jgi:hypothetical protein
MREKLCLLVIDILERQKREEIPPLYILPSRQSLPDNPLRNEHPYLSHQLLQYYSPISNTPCSIRPITSNIQPKSGVNVLGVSC